MKLTHVSAAMNKDSVIEELLEVVISIRFFPKLGRTRENMESVQFSSSV
jgi:hypothetical protein